MIKTMDKIFLRLSLDKRKAGEAMAELDFERKHAEDLQRLR